MDPTLQKCKGANNFYCGINVSSAVLIIKKRSRKKGTKDLISNTWILQQFRSVSLTAYPNGRRIFDRTAVTAHPPASVIDLSQAS